TGERRADHEPRTRPAAALSLRLRARELRAGRCAPRAAGRLVRRGLALCARLDQARLQLAQEVGVVRQRLADLTLDAAARPGAPDETVELVGGRFDRCVAPRHFLIGGASPVATRQM